MHTIRVHLARQVETVRVCQVGVCGRDGEDDCVLLLDVGHAHVADLLLNVLGLVADGHLGHAGQVDQGQVEHVGREDLEADGLVGHALVAAGNLVRVVDNLLAHLAKVEELLAGQVQELGPFVGLLGALLVGLGALGLVEELQDLSCAPRKQNQHRAKQASNTRGRRVTMPEPRGRKSRPTMFSSTELLPLLCL